MPDILNAGKSVRDYAPKSLAQRLALFLQTGTEYQSDVGLCESVPLSTAIALRFPALHHRDLLRLRLADRSLSSLQMPPGLVLTLYTRDRLQGTAVKTSVYSATGSSQSIASGRLSYTLGLVGPCYSIDTACASALAALHVCAAAVGALECESGVVVGTKVLSEGGEGGFGGGGGSGGGGSKMGP